MREGEVAQRTVMSGVLGPNTSFIIMADGPWDITAMERLIDHLNVMVGHFAEDEEAAAKLATQTPE